MVKDRLSELLEKAEFEDDPKIIEQYEVTELRNQKQILHDLDQFAEINGWIRDLQRNILDIEVSIFSEGVAKAGQKLQDNANLCFKIFNAVKRLQGELDKRQQEDDYDDDEMVNRVRSTQFESIKTAYYAAYWKYSGVVRRYEDKLKLGKMVVRSNDGIHQLARTGNKAFTNSPLPPEAHHLRYSLRDVRVQTFASLDEARDVLSAVEARHQDLLALEQSLVEMRDLFVLFSTLVMQHGSLLNLVEGNVQIAVEHVSKAAEDIKQARNYYRWQVANGRCCFFFNQMCIMLVVLAILSAILIWMVITRVLI